MKNLEESPAYTSITKHRRLTFPSLIFKQTKVTKSKAPKPKAAKSPGSKGKLKQAATTQTGKATQKKKSTSSCNQQKQLGKLFIQDCIPIQ